MEPMNDWVLEVRKLQARVAAIEDKVAALKALATFPLPDHNAKEFDLKTTERAHDGQNS